MIFTITVNDGHVYLYVDKKLVWSGIDGALVVRSRQCGRRQHTGGCVMTLFEFWAFWVIVACIIGVAVWWNP